MSTTLPAPNELAATVTEAARRFGDRPAVVAPDGRATTYAELDRASDVAGGWLQSQGLRPGDLLALALPSSPEHLALALGAAKAGVAHAGCNPRQSEPERAATLDVLQPSLVVGARELLGDTDHRCVEVEVGAGRGPDELPLPRVVRARDTVVRPPADPDRPVAVVLTSGTTGVPKAAVFTDRQVSAIRRLDVGEAWGGGGPMLVSTELCHVGIATKLTWYLRLGATLQLLERWRAGDALDVIERTRMTSVGGISSQFALLLRHPSFDARDLSAVTSLVAGGGPSSPALVREARARFGAPYSIRYSSTESGGVGCGTAFDADDEEALHTVGRPRPGVEVRIGEDGRVWLRSPTVMQGYHRAPEATAEVLVGGWLRTSDHGVIDDRGCLRLLGRASDSWVRGGHNVFPEPVEAALSTHPLVSEVAVVARADDVMGHVGVAMVVPADPAAPPSLDDLRAHAAHVLARHELPEDLRLVSSLPRTATDKIDRRVLAAG